MSFHNRLLLNRAAVSDLRMLEVMLLVASGRSAEVSSRIERLGGRVGREEPAVGYLRANVPTEKLVALVDQDGIAAYQIASNSRGSWYRDGPPQANAEMYRGFERVRGNTRPFAPKESALPMLPIEVTRSSGYTADDDAGVGKWLQDHPTFDGRGVTIAILEPAEVEFSHLMLAPAKSRDGRDIPKIAGILNTLDDDALDNTRVRLDAEIQAATAWNRVGDRTYALPRPGRFRLGVYTVPVDINLIHQFAIVMDSTSREIWVDTNGDADFRDETPVPDVNERFEPRALKFTYPNPLAMSFVVAHGRTPNVVHLYLALGGHHTMTTSVAAGSKAADGLAYGVAPGARVLLVRTNTADYRMRDVVEAFLSAAQAPDVDILSVSQGLLLAPDTAADFLGLFMRRVIVTYKTRLFHGAGNMQLYLNNISPLGDAFAVGGSMGPQTHATLFGGAPLEQLIVHPISASGPAIDGALKPDFLAPMQRLAADVYHQRAPILVPAWSPRFQLPPGYQISCCTSASAPYAAGVGALLLSAAKQEKLSVSLSQLQRALRVGAKFLEGWPAHQQGSGVLDVGAAWRELHNHVDIPTIRVTSSIAHPLARYAASASDGEGLYERDGWRVGMSGQRVMRFRRESGGAGPIDYRLSWTGNDGTFTAPSSLGLPLGAEVELPVGIAVRTTGAHSAILNLHDRATNAIVFRTLATIVAADRIDHHQHEIRVDGSLSVLRRSPHYVVLPEGGSALQVTLEVHSGTVDASILPSHSLYPNYFDHVQPLGGRLFTPGVYHVVLPYPAAGMWTVQVANMGSQRSGDAAATSGETATYSVTMRLLSATLRPQAVRSGQLTVEIENNSATLKEPVVETSIGTLRSHSGETVGNGLPNRFEIIVPEQASTLDLRLRSVGASKDDFELYLYDCTSGECFLHNFTLPAAREQRMVVRRPKAGRWVAAVNAAPFPAKPAHFVLDEVITGSVRSLARTSAARPASQRTWTDRFDLPSAPDMPADATPIVLVELVDAAMNREEEAHPWETRVNLGLTNLAGRRPAIGSAIYRLK